MARKKKTNRQAVVNKLDKYLSILVRMDGICITCGSRDNLTNGHLFSRIAYSTRWEPLNCHIQCTSCNLRHEYDPYPYTRWFIEKYGIDKYDSLHRQFVTPRQFKTFELEELYEKLQLDGLTR
jgi:hypothetical protein